VLLNIGTLNLKGDQFHNLGKGMRMLNHSHHQTTFGEHNVILIPTLDTLTAKADLCSLSAQRQHHHCQRVK